MPASALESLVLPARVAGYSPALLDELSAAGEVLWAGHGSLPGGDGWVSLHLADTAPLTLPDADPDAVSTPLHEAVLDALAGGGAFFFRQLVRRRRRDRRRRDARRAVGPGLGRARHRRHARPGARAARAAAAATARDRATPARPLRPRPPGHARPLRPADRGRSLVAAARPRARPDPARRTRSPRPCSTGTASSPAARSMSERAPGGFAAVYRVLAAFEETGRCRRGYFVEGLGAAQFAVPGAVDRLRAMARSRAYQRRVRRRRRGRCRLARAAARRHRPGQPVRRRAAVAHPRRRDVTAAGRTGHRPGARPAPSSCWSTATSRSTSSAAVAPC